jgi:hypothetical protein
MAKEKNLAPELQIIKDRIQPAKLKYAADNPGKRYVYSQSDKDEAISLVEGKKHPVSHVAAAFCTDPNSVKVWAGIKVKAKKASKPSFRTELVKVHSMLAVALSTLHTEVEYEKAKEVWSEFLAKIEKSFSDRLPEIQKAEKERQEKESKKRIKQLKTAMDGLSEEEKQQLKELLG